MLDRIELSDDVTRQFKAMYKSGVSFAVMAARLNEMFPGLGMTRHTSRDAAIRMGWRHRDTKDSVWLDEDVVAEFKRLHDAGLSHEIIATRLNEKFGLTLSRAACIARASRMRLSRPKVDNIRDAVARGLWKRNGGAHAARGTYQKKRGTRKVNGANGDLGILEELKAPEGEGISIDQLLPFSENAATSCRYPLGQSETRGLMYCGEPTHRGSWCEYHCEVVFKGGRHVAPEPVISPMATAKRRPFADREKSGSR